MAHLKHQQVRRRYAFQCGYCGVSETDVGGELTIDHYRPVSRGGTDDDENLVYACMRCNQYKSDTFPDAAQQAQGERILHPLLDDVAAHILQNDLTGFLEPRTVTGGFHINLLQLNRPALVANRQRRWRLELANAVIRSLADDVAFFRNASEELRSLLNDLQQDAGEKEN